MSDSTEAQSMQDLVASAQALAKQLPPGMKKLRLRTGDSSVEVEWAFAPAGAAPAAMAPMAAAPMAAAAAGGDMAGGDMGDEGGQAVTAPLVGTFYRSPDPNSPAFVEEGAAVEATTEVAIIEAMKIMNRIEAGVAGTIRKILVQDGEMVEFGQKLMIVDPA